MPAHSSRLAVRSVHRFTEKGPIAEQGCRLRRIGVSMTYRSTAVEASCEITDSPQLALRAPSEMRGERSYRG